MMDWIDGKLLHLFIIIGTRWFGHIAFSTDNKEERVRHIIFAQDYKWLEKIVNLIEANERIAVK